MTSYLRSTRDYFYNRRRRFAIIGGVVGGIYFVGRYAADKVREVQERIGKERRDKENLRRRFAQNQEDCTFTVLALLPTLGDQLFKSMDVEGLTSKLQQSTKKEVEAAPPLLSNDQVQSENETAKNGSEVPTSEMQESGVLVDRPEVTSEEVATEAEESRVEEKKDAALTSEVPEVNGTTSAETMSSVEEGSSTEGYTLPDQAKSELLPQAQDPTTTEQPTENKSSEIIPAQDSEVQEETKADPGPEAETKLVLESNRREEGVDSIAPSTVENESARESINQEPKPTETKSNGIFEPLPQPIKAGAVLTTTPPPEAPVPTESSSSAPTTETEDQIDPLASTTVTEEPVPSTRRAEVAPTPTPSAPDLLAEKRAKLALWNELKIVTFSRTLTSLYCIVLLTLQTHVQLNLIGRFAYVSSVSSLASETMAEDDDSETSFGNGSGMGISDPKETDGMEREKHFIRLENRAEDGEFDDDEEINENREEMEEIKRKQRQNRRDVKLGLSLSHENERTYLNFSWWFLHRGWESIESRVKEAVQEVVGSVPLKSQLSHSDFLKLLSQIRKRVEHEPRTSRSENAKGGDSLLHPSSSREAAQSDTGAESEGGVTSASEAGRSGRRRRGKKCNFLSALFPTTPTSEHEVLIQSGVLPPSSTLSSSPLTKDSQLRALLDETSDIIESPDFLSVLSLSLDRVFSVFDATMRPSFGVQPIPQAPSNRINDEHVEPSPPPRFMELMDGVDDERFGKKVRLAALFPAVARQSQLALHGNPNEYVECLADVKELRALSAVIFSAWST